jgi:hypothetical protein
MDHDRIDDLLPPARHQASVEREASTERPDDHLAGTIGNAAFTRVVQGASTPAVDRAGPRSQGAGPLDPEIAGDIEAARGGGQPLADPVRADMQQSLGVDLSAVRIHADPRADALTRSVQAEAFTTGTDVFFRSGAYQPDSSDGRRLLGHELTHVVQQTSGQVEGGRVSHPDDAHEVEARSVGDTVAASPAPDVAVSRQDLPQEEEEEDLGEGAVQPAVARQDDEDLAEDEA